MYINKSAHVVMPPPSILSRKCLSRYSLVVGFAIIYDNLSQFLGLQIEFIFRYAQATMFLKVSGNVFQFTSE
jgi:hypothetical protein